MASHINHHLEVFVLLSQLPTFQITLKFPKLVEWNVASRCWGRLFVNNF